MQQAAQRNAIEFVRQDHQKIKDLFEAFEESDDPSEQKELLGTIILELNMHAQLEDQIFYPAVREATQANHLLDQAQEEHQDADAVMEDLQNLDPGHPLFSDKFIELEDKVLHHIQEEELGILSQAIESNLDLDSLGKSMLEFKNKLLAKVPSTEEKPARSKQGTAPSARRKKYP
jgi:hemerythrin superfamily protein